MDNSFVNSFELECECLDIDTIVFSVLTAENIINV